MRGDITRKILEAVADTSSDTMDIFAILLTNPRPSYSRLDYELRKRQRDRNQQEFDQKEKRHYYLMLNKLRREGLIKKTIKNKKSIFKITQRGVQKLKSLQELVWPHVPQESYSAETSNNLTILTFDIPEKQRRKRDWLRGVLRSLGLRMIQKSVWLGKVKLPQDFLEDLRDLNLLNCTEIFEVTKTGSLIHIV